MYNIDEILNTIIEGNVTEVLKNFPDESIDMVITSPPYWNLRDYGIEGQFGLETTYEEYIAHLVSVFEQVRRILKREGSCWVNIGDCYNGSGKCSGEVWSGDKVPKNSKKQSTNKGSRIDFKTDIKEIAKKSLVGIPDRFKIAMIDDGWICRNDIIWKKPNGMPESVKDRFTVDYERLFFFTKNGKYYFEQQKEKCINGDPNPPRGSKGNKILNSGLRNKDKNAKPTEPLQFRNIRSVWDISTQPIRDAHFATFPEKLLDTPIKSSCPAGGVVLDIFFGSGTTGKVAKSLNRNWIGIELNPEYIEIAKKRLSVN